MSVKHLLLLAFIGVRINFIVGQTAYHHFPTSNAVWRVDHIENQCGLGNLARSYQYMIGTDTIIGSLTYKKVYGSGMQYCGMSAYIDSTYIGGIRYDSINKKVHFNFPGFSDTILYNFNLQVGDTMHTVGAFFNSAPIFYSYVISTIDSILINTSYHKRYTTEHPFYSVIEGIGGSCGLIEPLFQNIDNSFQLKCFSSNLYVYPDSLSSCPLVENTVGINQTDFYSDNIVIAPNPINGEGTIELKSKSKIEKIEIYNCLGTLLVQTVDLPSNNFKLTRNQFNPGVYTTRLFSSTGQITISKFVIY